MEVVPDGAERALAAEERGPPATPQRHAHTLVDETPHKRSITPRRARLTLACSARTPWAGAACPVCSLGCVIRVKEGRVAEDKVEGMLAREEGRDEGRGRPAGDETRLDEGGEAVARDVGAGARERGGVRVRREDVPAVQARTKQRVDGRRARADVRAPHGACARGARREERVHEADVVGAARHRGAQAVRRQHDVQAVAREQQCPRQAALRRCVSPFQCISPCSRVVEKAVLCCLCENEL